MQKLVPYGVLEWLKREPSSLSLSFLELLSGNIITIV